MINVDKIDVMNMESAFRGMRNPMESWDKANSDSDMKLAIALTKAGSDHAKFLRQIFISMDINAPDYFWKEFDTYKVGTVANSTSTMHKLGSRLLTEHDFSWDTFSLERVMTLFRINLKIKQYQKHKDSEPAVARYIWRKIIQDLPMGFNYLRTVTLNYEVARNMYHARNKHKLEEWQHFCTILTTLPASELITLNKT